METRVGELERRVEGLERTVERLAGRLASLEAQGPLALQALVAAQEAAAPVAMPPAPLLPDGVVPGLPAPVDRSPEVLALVGRTFLVIGGAFLVRAITDRDVLPHGVGVALGLAFASSWVLLSARAAAAGQRRNADFHAASAMLVGFPLIVETGTRLNLVSPPAASAALVAFTALLLAAADRSRLPGIAWVSMLAAAIAVLLLPDASAGSVASLAALTSLALAAALLAERRGWTGLRWPVALLLDLLLVRFTTGAMALQDVQRRAALAPWLLGLAWAAVALYLAAQVERVFVRARSAGPFELAQPLLVMAAALFVSARAAPGAVHSAAGAGVLAAGLLALVGAERLSRSGPRARDAAIFGGLGVAFVVGGGAVLTDATPVALFWAALGLAFALLGRRRSPSLWWAVGLALTLAAAVRGGVFAAAIDGLLARDAAARQPTLVTWVVLALAVASAASVAARRDRSVGAPAFLSLGHLLPAALGLAAAVAFLALALAPRLSVEPSALALVRTLSLVGGALGFALAQRRARTPELAWAAFALLGLSLVKLLAQDLPQGHPLSQVVALSVFGCAIIALPRLLRR